MHLRLVLGISVLLVVLGSAPAAAQDDMTYQDFVDQYGDWTRADVEAAGYIVDDMCVTAEAEGLPAELGAMGFHAVHPTYVADGVADPEKPDAILLNADDEVIGIEFEIPEVRDPPPEIAGVPLEYTPPHPGMDFEHMSLHVYFVGDEAHHFGTWNPAVSCPEGTGAAHEAHADAAHADEPDVMPTTGITDYFSGSQLAVLAALLLLVTALVGRRLETRGTGGR